MPYGILIIGLIITIIVGGCWYLGAFSPVTVSEQELPPMTVAYESLIGPYQQSGKIMDKVYEELLKNGIATTHGFGIYYDSPKEVKAEKLRSIAGCLISDNQTNLPTSIKKMTLPTGRVVHTTFPFRHQISVLFGIMRVYPALESFRIAHNLPKAPVMEVYDVPNKTIHYYYLSGINLQTLESYLQ